VQLPSYFLATISIEFPPKFLEINAKILLGEELLVIVTILTSWFDSPNTTRLHYKDEFTYNAELEEEKEEEKEEKEEK